MLIQENEISLLESQMMSLFENSKTEKNGP